MHVTAENADDVIKQVGFTYQINYPDNQITEGGALNLQMEPEQKQQVIVTIRNTSDHDLTLELALNGARTNGHGGLEYGPSGFKEDKSMVYDLPDLVSLPTELVVPKQSSENITLDIKMPAVAFDGIVTGGLRMIEKGEQTESVTETGIVNKVAYLFGITLQMSTAEVSPELELQRVYPEQANFRNAIFLDVANTKPMKIKDLMLEVEVTNQGKSDVLYSSKKNNMEMAPNTLMAYPVSLDGEGMVAGKYTAHVLASAHGKEWKWEEDFTISKEDAAMFNLKDVNLVQERGLNWQLVVGIVASLVILIAGGYFGRKRFNKKKQVLK